MNAVTTVAVTAFAKQFAKTAVVVAAEQAASAVLLTATGLVVRKVQARRNAAKTTETTKS